MGASSGVPLKERYLALDVLRGMTFALMVVVNTPGTWSYMYAPLAHASWHGFTPTDLVYPTFLFVVGVAMSFSMKRLIHAGHSVVLKRIFTRTFLIFAIGWGLNAYPFFDFYAEGGIALRDFGAIRLLGVLQRIALCYMLASLLVYFVGKRGVLITSAITLLAYWGVLYYFGDARDPYSMAGNAAVKLDLWAIGARNMWTGEAIPFEPEGILSTFPATINVIAGYFTGQYIQKHGNSVSVVKTLMLTGGALVLLSLAWNPFFPINKKIWTSSYVLLTIGLDLMLIAVLIQIIEIWKVRKWTCSMEVFGRNPLVLYVLSQILISTLYTIQVGDTHLQRVIFEGAFLSWLSIYNASLLFALFYTGVIWLTGWWMDRNKIYIKV